MDNIDPKILANMTTHYSSLLKNGATALGGDAMSKSIFAAIDKDQSGVISQVEIDTAIPLLSEILKNAAQKTMAFAKVMFGTKPQEEYMNEQIAKAYKRLTNYAKEHPEDTKLQEYAKKADELMKEGRIISAELDDEASGQYFGQNDTIKMNYMYYENPDKVLSTLIHELGHAINGDCLDSLAEEKNVETYARELAVKITGKPLENTISMEDFINTYKKDGYPLSSPGNNGIPINAGVTISYPIDSVKKFENNYVIKSKPNEKGRYIETQITFGEKTDKNGNLLPVSAKEKLYNEDGNILSTTDLGKYNEIEKIFLQEN